MDQDSSCLVAVLSPSSDSQDKLLLRERYMPYLPQIREHSENSKNSNTNARNRTAELGIRSHPGLCCASLDTLLHLGLLKLFLLAKRSQSYLRSQLAAGAPRPGLPFSQRGVEGDRRGQEEIEVRAPQVTPAQVPSVAVLLTSSRRGQVSSVGAGRGPVSSDTSQTRGKMFSYSS